MDLPTVIKQLASPQSVIGYIGEDFEQIVIATTAAIKINRICLNDTADFELADSFEVVAENAVQADLCVIDDSFLRCIF